ncbi:MAG: hypothetical protein K2L51_03315 [Clostridiales bacterium]|nr:hypothetical protein [Clostridiales bacterium]
MKTVINRKCALRALVALLCVLTAVLFAVGCDTKKESLPKLATPENLQVSAEGTITWDAVENATGYTLTLDGMPFTTADTFYTPLYPDEGFTVSVTATAEGYRNSDPTETITFAGIKEKITVAIEGKSEVGSGKSVRFTTRVAGTTNRTVRWSIVSGKEYATVDNRGELTAKEVTGDKIVRLRATSTEDASAYAEKTVCILARSELTQQMLAELQDKTKMSYDALITVNLYPGMTDRVSSTHLVTTHAALNESEKLWYASYEDGNTGRDMEVFCAARQSDNVACQLELSLRNEAEYTPLKDDEGKDIAWADADYGNLFKMLTVNDFTFDEDGDFRWKFNGDAAARTKLLTSVTPYEFNSLDLSLLIDGGKIVGIRSKSLPNYAMVPSYRAEQELVATVEYGEAVVVPSVKPYTVAEKDRAAYDRLTNAIANMQALTSYKLDFRMASATTTDNVRINGYTETITPNDCYYAPYTMTAGVPSYELADVYGYHKIDSTLYNSYRAKEAAGSAGGEVTYTANPTRAFTTDFSETKPSFAFAAPIFTDYRVNEQEKSATFYIDADNARMMQVPTTFYRGVTNDDQMYGMFATVGRLSSTQAIIPYVVVEEVEGKDYITGSGFYFQVGYFAGLVQITYSDFGNVTMPEDIPLTGVQWRQMPVAWQELTIADMETDEEIPADTFMKTYFGLASEVTVHAEIPFFGSVLGDTYGFGTTTVRQVGMGALPKTLALYYDVPLDSDYTIASSVEQAARLLGQAGYVKDAYGRFRKTGSTLVIEVVDENLDLFIYVWQPQGV